MSFPGTATLARQDWMQALSTHFEEVRRTHPDDELCIVFDIDGTILDMRHLVVHVLLAYDRRVGTRHFHGLVAGDISRHEDDIEQILDDLDVPTDPRDDVLAFYRAKFWTREALLASSRPFEGVLGVIRWFQLQPRTQVALNTGRPEHMHPRFPQHDRRRPSGAVPAVPPVHGDGGPLDPEEQGGEPRRDSTARSADRGGRRQ